MTRTALITGSAGFIGYFTARRLLDQGWRVIGLDAMTDYYDVTLKERRHAMLNQSAGFSAVTERLETPGVLRDLFETHRPDAVIHLAAQAGLLARACQKLSPPRWLACPCQPVLAGKSVEHR